MSMRMLHLDVEKGLFVDSWLSLKRRSSVYACGHKNHTINTCWDLNGRPTTRAASIATTETDAEHMSGLFNHFNSFIHDTYLG